MGNGYLQVWKTSSMCQECARLQTTYEDASARLATAQRELAGYAGPRDQEAFASLWKDCLSKLRDLWGLRETMALHVASHDTSALSSHE